jgi:hypothetical protein
MEIRIKYFSLFLFYVILLVLTFSLAVLDSDEGTAHTDAVYVDLGYSRYRGSVLSAGVNQFLGIRYAAAPVGNLRWRAPADPLQTDGIQDAIKVCCYFSYLSNIRGTDNPSSVKPVSEYIVPIHR